MNELRRGSEGELLFRERYPKDYIYFRSAIEKSIALPGTDDEERAELIRMLAQLEAATVHKKCACGEAGCSTFSFVDYAAIGYGGSFELEGGGPQMTVVDVDHEGNLIGVEKVPH
ncbi:MAG: hypothetical protein ABR584_10165 [Candidatus Baltobacteraceae bacterium]